ncbi:MAG TPA: hypothetical protein VH418_21365 [Solirubrobacteraceae bacterium]|jgi:hypothetical protein
MRKLISRRPTPAFAVALVALFMALGGVSYAAVVTTPTLPSFTSHGVALVPGNNGNAGAVLPITGANTSGLANHGMTLSGSAVIVPKSGIYDLTLYGNCNAGATNSSLMVREGNGLIGNPVDLWVGLNGNGMLSGANTIHLNAGTRLNMVAAHGGISVDCGATMGVTLVSAD